MSHIEFDRHRQGGEPCIAGTRTPVSIIARLLELPNDEIRHWYPWLTDDDVEAVRWFDAAYSYRHKRKRREAPPASPK